MSLSFSIFISNNSLCFATCDTIHKCVRLFFQGMYRKYKQFSRWCNIIFVSIKINFLSMTWTAKEGHNSHPDQVMYSTAYISVSKVCHSISYTHLFPFVRKILNKWHLRMHQSVLNHHAINVCVSRRWHDTIKWTNVGLSHWNWTFYKALATRYSPLDTLHNNRLKSRWPLCYLILNKQLLKCVEMSHSVVIQFILVFMSILSASGNSLYFTQNVIVCLI